MTPGRKPQTLTFATVDVLGRERRGLNFSVVLLRCKTCGHRWESGVRRCQLKHADGEDPVCMGCVESGHLPHPSKNRVSGRYCAVCCGLPWHRPRHARCACGELYADEAPIQREPATVRSSLGSWGAMAMGVNR